MGKATRQDAGQSLWKGRRSAWSVWQAPRGSRGRHGWNHDASSEEARRYHRIQTSRRARQGYRIQKGPEVGQGLGEREGARGRQGARRGVPRDETQRAKEERQYLWCERDLHSNEWPPGPSPCRSLAIS